MDDTYKTFLKKSSYWFEKSFSNKGNHYREGGWKCDLNYHKIW